MRNRTPGADQRLCDALEALWDDPALHGCYSDRWTDRAAQQAAGPVAEPIDHPASQYGIAALPGGAEVVCLSVVVRFEGNDREEGDDWLATIAERVHRRAGLDLGLIGFEVSGEDWTFTGEAPTSTHVSYLVPGANGLRLLKPSAWTGA